MVDLSLNVFQRAEVFNLMKSDTFSFMAYALDFQSKTSFPNSRVKNLSFIFLTEILQFYILYLYQGFIPS